MQGVKKYITVYMKLLGKMMLEVVDRVGVDKPESVSKFLLENLDSSYVSAWVVLNIMSFNIDDDIPLYVKAGNLARIAYYRKMRY